MLLDKEVCRGVCFPKSLLITSSAFAAPPADAPCLADSLAALSTLSLYFFNPIAVAVTAAISIPHGPKSFGIKLGKIDIAKIAGVSVFIKLPTPFTYLFVACCIC